jgi:hypothetical protein
MGTLCKTRHDAYCAFMRRHRSTVWRVCWRFARRGRGSRDDRKARAEDLAQEVWIVLWLKFDQLDPAVPEARQRRWLEKITETDTLFDLLALLPPDEQQLIVAGKRFCLLRQRLAEYPISREKRWLAYPYGNCE